MQNNLRMELMWKLQLFVVKLRMQNKRLKQLLHSSMEVLACTILGLGFLVWMRVQGPGTSPRSLKNKKAEGSSQLLSEISKSHANGVNSASPSADSQNGTSDNDAELALRKVSYDGAFTRLKESETGLHRKEQRPYILQAEKVNSAYLINMLREVNDMPQADDEADSAWVGKLNQYYEDCESSEYTDSHWSYCSEQYESLDTYEWYFHLSSPVLSFQISFIYVSCFALKFHGFSYLASLSAYTVVDFSLKHPSFVVGTGR
ncbi:hypothetical protein Nepgr_006879 [Nepenthes gracilis]|uniref:Uncharacterized protein n=1 Tax=Nepenthes gracilis TaxID=150966 RepID=A0AAD3XHT0_NEPGR|nr:hypothetical protein Nepgr_006879 [Nepenthes gracilis]